MVQGIVWVKIFTQTTIEEAWTEGIVRQTQQEETIKLQSILAKWVSEIAEFSPPTARVIDNLISLERYDRTVINNHAICRTDVQKKVSSFTNLPVDDRSILQRKEVQ